MKNFVTDFGANPAAPDNTIAIAAGLAAMAGDDIVLPKGRYNVHSSVLNFAAKGCVVGEGRGDSVLVSLDASGDVLSVSAGYSSVENIAFDSAVRRTSGAYLALTPSSGFNRIEQIAMRGYYVGLKVHTSAGLQARGLDIQNCSDVNSIAIDIDCPLGAGFALSIADFLVSSSIPMSDPAFVRPGVGLWIKGAGDINLTNGNFILCQNALILAPPAGREVSSFRATAVDFDNSSNVAAIISPMGAVLRSTFTDCWFASSTNIGVLIDTSVGGRVDGINFTNPQIFANGCGTGNPGLYAVGSGTNNINISDPQCAANGGSGLLFDSSIQGFNVHGGNSGACGGFGGNNRFGVEIADTITRLVPQFVVAEMGLNGNGIASISCPGGISPWRRIYGIPGVVPPTSIF